MPEVSSVSLPARAFTSQTEIEWAISKMLVLMSRITGTKSPASVSTANFQCCGSSFDDFLSGLIDARVEHGVLLEGGNRCLDKEWQVGQFDAASFRCWLDVHDIKSVRSACRRSAFPPSAVSASLWYGLHAAKWNPLLFGFVAFGVLYWTRVVKVPGWQVCWMRLTPRLLLSCQEVCRDRLSH